MLFSDSTVKALWRWIQANDRNAFWDGDDMGDEPDGPTEADREGLEAIILESCEGAETLTTEAGASKENR